VLLLGLAVILLAALPAGAGREGSSKLEEQANDGAPRAAAASQGSGSGLGRVYIALASASVGAVVGAFSTFVVTELREARQRMRTLMGYSRLLAIELEANKRVADEVDKQHDKFVMSLDSAKYTAPRIETWLEIRVKLAPLLKTDEFHAFNEYYRLLQMLLDLKEGNTAEEGGMPVRDFVQRLRRYTETTQGIVSKYANPPSHKRSSNAKPRSNERG
jgi:hypothetical protein